MRVGATGVRSVAAVALFGAFTVLAAIIGWMALPACGFALPGIGQIINSCNPSSTAITSAEQLDRLNNAILQEELLMLERQLALAPRCTAPQNAVPLHGTAALNGASQRVASSCAMPRSDNVALLVDASESMNWSFTLDPEIEKLMATGNLSASDRDTLIQRILSAPGTPRIDVARQALKQLSAAADPAVSFDLISFGRCGPPEHRGKFNPADRSRLAQSIDGIQAGNNTALAAAISTLPALLPPQQTGAQTTNVVLVSDGYDSCGGDPCAMAASVKQARPDITISVVAMASSLELLRCVSDATGGLFLRPDGVEALAPLLRSAAGQATGEPC